MLSLIFQQKSRCATGLHGIEFRMSELIQQNKGFFWCVLTVCCVFFFSHNTERICLSQWYTLVFSASSGQKSGKGDKMGSSTRECEVEKILAILITGAVPLSFINTKFYLHFISLERPQCFSIPQHSGHTKLFKYVSTDLPQLN